jgi:hypothetical protein
MALACARIIAERTRLERLGIINADRLDVMECTECSGPLEHAGEGAYARCRRCFALFITKDGQQKRLVVKPPGDEADPEYHDLFERNLGFGPRAQIVLARRIANVIIGVIVLAIVGLSYFVYSRS